MRIILDEYSGATSFHVDAPVSDNSGASQDDCADAGTITTTVANTLIHSAAAADGNDDADLFTAGTGYTIHDLGPDPNGSDKTMTQHRVAATASGYNTEMCNINDYSATAAVAYVPAGGGGGDTMPPASPSNLKQIVLPN
jgi:hypothetical protein